MSFLCGECIIGKDSVTELPDKLGTCIRQVQTEPRVSQPGTPLLAVGFREQF